MVLVALAASSGNFWQRELLLLLLAISGVYTLGAMGSTHETSVATPAGLSLTSRLAPPAGETGRAKVRAIGSLTGGWRVPLLPLLLLHHNDPVSSEERQRESNSYEEALARTILALSGQEGRACLESLVRLNRTWPVPDSDTWNNE